MTIAADRLMQATTATDTSALTLGAVWGTGYQTLAQALASGALSAGQKIEGCVLDTSTGAWETSVYTITNGTTLARDFVRTSSNGGLPVAFAAGTKQFMCTVSSARLAEGLVDPDDVCYIVVPVAGQSNAAEYPSYDTAAEANDSRVHQWNATLGDANYNKIMSSSLPLAMITGLRTGKFGLSTAYLRAYAQSLPPNFKVLAVPIAAGSTGLVGAEWQPGNPGGQHFERFILEVTRALAAAKAQYPKSRLGVTLWGQGENDALTKKPGWQYALNLKAMFNGWRTRLNAPNMAFVISGMTPEGANIYGSSYWNAIDAAHQQVAAEMDRVVYVKGPSGLSSNSEHWNADGVRVQGPACAQAARAAMRSVGKDTTAPQIVAASVENTTPTFVNLTFTELLDGASVPTATALASSVPGHTVSGVAINGNQATLTLTTAFTPGENRSFTYAKPASGFFRDLAANPLADGATFAITNNVAGADTTAPKISSTTGPAIPSGAASTIVLTFDEALAAGNPPTSAFTVTGTQSSVTGVAVSGATVTLTMAAAYVAGNTASVSYAPTGTTDLQDGAGNKVAAFGPLAVTNNAAASGGGGTTTYATLSATDHNAGIAISGGNLVATATAAGFISARASAGAKDGVRQFEATMTAGTSGIVGVGIATTPLNSFPGGDNPAAASMGYYSAGQRYVSNGNVGAMATFTTNDTIGVVVDFTAKTIEFLKKGVSQGVFAMPSGMVAALDAGNSVYPMVATNGAGIAFSVTMGAPALSYPKSGATGFPA